LDGTWFRILMPSRHPPVFRLIQQRTHEGSPPLFPFAFWTSSFVFIHLPPCPFLLFLIPGPPFLPSGQFFSFSWRRSFVVTPTGLLSLGSLWSRLFRQSSSLVREESRGLGVTRSAFPPSECLSLPDLFFTCLFLPVFRVSKQFLFFRLGLCSS